MFPSSAGSRASERCQCGGHLGDDAIGIMDQALPCETQYDPSSKDEHVLPFAVALEGPSIRVKCAAVGLDRDLQLEVCEVDLSENSPLLIVNRVIGHPCTSDSLE